MYRQRLFTDKDGTRVAFDLIIHDPAPAEGSESDFFCKVEAAALFLRPKDVYGVGADQAAELAKRLIEIRLGDVPVYDEAGRRVLNIDIRESP